MRKLIYIMGCAHCGSTLLTSLLGRHRAIATIGELKVTAIRNIETYQCSCGQPMLRCAFWSRIQAACQQRGLTLDLASFQTHYRGGGWWADRLIRAAVRGPGFEQLRALGLRFWPSVPASLQRYDQRNQVVIDAICETEGKPVFLDGSKDPARLLHLARSQRFDLRAIHLVRDGRAIVASYKKRNPDIHHTVGLWKTKAVECERAKALFPSRQMMTLRYEDLCADVSGALRQVFQFCGVADESESCQTHDPNLTSHIIGHNSRMGGNREVRLRQEWRTLLSAEDLQVFRQQEDDLNQRYGYTWNDDSAPSAVGATTSLAK